MLASDIIDRAGKLLNDEGQVTYTSSELLNWLNDGQREVVIFRPDANAQNQAIPLVAGDTKQDLPDGGIRLLDVVRNMGVDGLTAGSPVRVIEREVLDAQVPTWHADAAADEIEHFVYNPVDPKRFYVYPKPDSVIYVEAVFSAVPATLDDVTEPIGLDDIYVNALVDYVAYRAYAKDTEFVSSAQRAAAHYQAFQSALGAKTQIDAATTPGGGGGNG